MRILLYSHWFAPSIGGVETISEILAEEFVRAGMTVTVVTQTAGADATTAYRVVRHPSLMTLFALGREADIIFQNTISVRTLIVWLLCGKPIVVTHPSWLQRGDGSRGIENYAKLLLLRLCHNVAISKAIATALPVPSMIIGNPFQASVFDGLRDHPRDRDIVFMGRLIPEKGCSLLLQALAKLKAKGLAPTLTVIGDGPERGALEAMTRQLELQDQVQFLGPVRAGRGETVARHRLMAVPSLWEEPFGVVALEGIASGCAVVASSLGGLPDAVGPCGLYFPNGDVDALATALERVLTDGALRQELLAHGPEHLARFQPGTVAGAYLELFRRVLAKSSR